MWSIKQVARRSEEWSCTYGRKASSWSDPHQAPPKNRKVDPCGGIWERGCFWWVAPPS